MAEPIPIPSPSLGVRPDLDPEDIDDRSLIAAENMIVRNGDFRTRNGFTEFGATSLGFLLLEGGGKLLLEPGPGGLLTQPIAMTSVLPRPVGLVNYEHADGSARQVLGTINGWHRLTNTGWALIGEGLTGTPSDLMVFRTFSKAGSTYLLGTNGANPLKQWDGTAATYSDVLGDPPRARCMCVIFDRVVLGNLLSGDTISPVAIDVSANKDFDAGWSSELVALLADTDGPIVSMQEMGTLQAAILKSDAICVLIAQASTAPFRIEWRKIGIVGPASALMSAKLADGSIVWTGHDGSTSVFDGANVQPLPYAIQRQIMRTANVARMSRGFMVFDSDRRELWIIYPLSGSDDPNGGVLINMTTMACYPLRFAAHKMTAGAKLATQSGTTIGDLNVPIGSLTGTIGDFSNSVQLHRLVLADSGGRTYQDIGDTDAGIPIPFHWESPVRGRSERYVTVDRIRHRFAPTQGAQNVRVKVGKRNLGGDVAYGTGTAVNIGTNRRVATGARQTAEFFGLRFEGTANKRVVYQGSAAYVKPRGRR